MRSASAEINLNALHHNYQVARSKAPNSKIFVLLKADAYGHGLPAVAAALQPLADGFAVCNLAEAICLRELGIQQPVLVLHGFYQASEIAEFAAWRLQTVVHHAWQLAALEATSVQQPLQVWLKIDTGMGRLGFSLDAAPAAYQRLQAMSGIAAPIGVMTHFAAADDGQDTYTTWQLQRFFDCVRNWQVPVSIANSAGLLAWPASHADWNRPGIMLYGSSPLIGKSASDLGLQPVMRLHSPLFAVNWHQAGDTIGYGHTWTCPEAMPVGLVAIGYGDGYPRHAPSGTPLYLGRQRVPLIGRVSMDSVAVDLRGVRNPQLGESVELWGPHVPVDEVAAKAGTLGYELLCSVAALKHVYLPLAGAGHAE